MAHGDVGGAFGDEAVGFAAHDGVEGGLDAGVGGEVGGGWCRGCRGRSRSGLRRQIRPG